MHWNQVDWPLPLGSLRIEGPLPEVREGHSPLERAALSRFEAVLPAMSVRGLVRTAVFPDTLADVARWAELKNDSQLHNVLTGVKAPGTRIRRVVARRLGLELADLALIDRPRAAVPPGEAVEGARDGSARLERLARERLQANLAAMTPGGVLSLVVWPFSLAELAGAIGVKTGDLYNMLAGVPRLRYPVVRERLATFLGCPVEWLDHLVDAPRAEPVPLVAG